MISFWTAWCVPCKREAPLFQEAYERYSKEVKFVGIGTADCTGDARSSSATGPLSQRSRSRHERAQGLQWSPSRARVIGRAWTVSGYIYGETREEALRSAIEQALATWARVCPGAVAPPWPLVAAPGAPSAERAPTLADLEGVRDVPVCNTTLDQSSSPAAPGRSRTSSLADPGGRLEGGDQGQARGRLRAVRSWPRRRKARSLAWLLPFVGLVGGALVLAALAWRWSRGRGPPAG